MNRRRSSFKISEPTWRKRLSPPQNSKQDPRSAQRIGISFCLAPSSLHLFYCLSPQPAANLINESEEPSKIPARRGYSVHFILSTYLLLYSHLRNLTAFLGTYALVQFLWNKNPAHTVTRRILGSSHTTHSTEYDCFPPAHLGNSAPTYIPGR